MILDNNKYINTTQAISADTAYIMNRMMWNVLHSSKGTAYGKGPDGEMDSVAKTGTTSNYKDYTFAGLTPYYVTAIWWGCDRPTEMDTLGKAGKNASPIQYAWKYLMEDLQADLPVKEFAKGENVVEKRFDTSTGAIVSGGGAVGYYTEDNLPDSKLRPSRPRTIPNAAPGTGRCGCRGRCRIKAFPLGGRWREAPDEGRACRSDPFPGNRGKSCSISHLR